MATVKNREEPRTPPVSSTGDVNIHPQICAISCVNKRIVIPPYEAVLIPDTNSTPTSKTFYKGAVGKAVYTIQRVIGPKEEKLLYINNPTTHPLVCDEEDLVGIAPDEPNAELKKFAQSEEKLNVQIASLLIPKDLPPDMSSAFVSLALSHKEIFFNKDSKLGITGIPDYDVQLASDEPLFTPQYPIPQKYKVPLTKEIETMLKLGIIEPAFSKFNSPVLILPKPHGGFRFLFDARKINTRILRRDYPIPRVPDLLNGSETQTKRQLKDRTNW